MTEPVPFPFQDTLGDGDYRVTEELRRGGDEQLYLGTRAHHPGERFLISVSAQANMPIDLLRPQAHVDGVFDVVHVGNFDQLGVDPLRDVARRDHYALVEKLPMGEPLARVVSGPLAPRLAVELGGAVAEIALEASRRGIVLDGLRPDYVWVQRDGDRPVVTGVGSRNRAFFGCARPRSMVTRPLFENVYTTPEQVRGEPAEAVTPVFLIATMIAEWITLKFPFPTRDSMRAGSPQALELPRALADVLARAFTAAPGRRTTLAGFIDELRRIAL